jgi:hypothetical protein
MKNGRSWQHLALEDEVRAWVEVCDGWSSWDVPCGPPSQDLKGVCACLNRLLHTLRSAGEFGFVVLRVRLPACA